MRQRTALRTPGSALVAALLMLAAAVVSPATAQPIGEADPALRSLLERAESGDASAQNNLGFMYRHGRGVPRDHAEAVKWFRRAAEQGDASAQNNLGFMYRHGLGVPRDHAEAVKWFRRAAEQGDASAQNNLGFMYRHGLGVPRDHAEAVKWYRRAAEQGNASAQNNLGLMYRHGLGVPRDHAEAMKWFSRAAEQGNASAQNNLGLMYRHGLGVPRDHAEAVKWFRRAAEQGNASAQFNLGAMYRHGRGVLRDHAEAVKWYRRAAEQGNASAQNNLGLMYRHGLGVPRDHAEAVKWFRRAAEQGDASAQNNLGLMYRHGLGVPRDHAEAVKWFRRAAEQGDASAQFNLGAMYRHGRGVLRDHAEAVKWFRRAAEQGDASAQFNLGVMYDNGLGVPRDLVLAHMWLNLGASGLSDGDDKDRYDMAKRNRDRVARSLSRRDLARAQRLARDWRPNSGAAPSSPAPGATDGGDTRRRVAAVQRSLARLGHVPGAADGLLGARTRAAIRAFQRAAGLPVDGTLSDGLERALLSTLADGARRALKRVSTGSGFRVSADGHVLTNAHVVRGCAEMRVGPADPAAVAARDEAADLALLEGPPGGAVAAFRQGRGVRPGAPVVVAGYPLPGTLAPQMNVTAGNVSALAGPGEDRLRFQITAPVQRGNSGGPVLDSAGNAVGVVVSKLDALKVARTTGDIPQNVNFAIGAGAARRFLDAEGIAYETAPSGGALAPEDIASAAKAFTVLVECWK